MSSEVKNSPQGHRVFAGTNLVLVANELNLSIFKPIWLGKFEIIKPDEFTDACIISPAAIQIPTPHFTLAILPNRLQIAFTAMEDENVVEPLNRVVGGILKNLPHTPLLALGINFDFLIAPADASQFAEWNKKNFASESALAICGDQTKKPRFGSCFSMNVENMRLKVDAKPVHNVVANPKIMEALKVAPEWMQFNFNFHLDLDSEAPVKHALESLVKWNVAASLTRSIINQMPA